MRAILRISGLLLALTFSRAAHADSMLVQLKPCPVKGLKCWIGDRGTFDSMPWKQDVDFDPKVAMPQLKGGPDDYSLEWLKTPANCEVRNEAFLRVGLNYVWRTTYTETGPANDFPILKVVIFSWNGGRPFCIGFGDSYFKTDEGMIEDSPKGARLSVLALVHGTGAYRSEVVFKFGSDGPHLVRLTGVDGKSKGPNQAPGE